MCVNRERAKQTHVDTCVLVSARRHHNFTALCFAGGVVDAFMRKHTVVVL